MKKGCPFDNANKWITLLEQKCTLLIVHIITL